MVKGLDLFREHFRDYCDSFIIIGGTACAVVMEQAGLDFRSTKDIDMVLVVEALSPDFFKVFWSFVQDGGYEHRQQSTDKNTFYRFSKPSDGLFPYMLELFSRIPDSLQGIVKGHLTPIPATDGASDLSAILLDDEYYGFIHRGVRQIDSLPIARPEYLIPLKAKAWLDLSRRKARGELVDNSNIKKHAKDIVSLFDIVNPNDSMQLAGSMVNDLNDFLTAASLEFQIVAGIREDIAAFYGIS